MRTSDLFVAVTLTVLTTGCGSGSRQLQSLAVTPAAANPGSLSTPVQFEAIGTFTDGSKAQVSALWTLNPPFCPVGHVCALDLPGWITLSNSGVAVCTDHLPGTGKWTVFATAPVDTNTPISKITMNTKTVAATAQLTCP